MRHARVPETVFMDKRLSTPERMLIVALDLCADGAGKAFPSIGRLTEYTAMARRTVIYNLHSLEEKGIVTKIKRPLPKTTVYVLASGYFYGNGEEKDSDRMSLSKKRDSARDALSSVSDSARDALYSAPDALSDSAPDAPRTIHKELSKELGAEPSQNLFQNPPAKEGDSFEEQLRAAFQDIAAVYPRPNNLKKAFEVFKSFFSREDPEQNERRFQNIGEQAVLYAEEKADGKCIHNFNNWLRDVADPDFKPVSNVTTYRRVEDE